MPAKTVTVYSCDRCSREEPNPNMWLEWSAVIIPSDPPADAGQQLLCPGCVGQAQIFMAGLQIYPLVAPVAA